MRKIKKVKLFPNNNISSLKIVNELKNSLKKYDFELSDDFDLAIAIGGDGSFLRMVKECNFNKNVYYIGINTGTLGFAQEIYPNEIDEFLNKLNKSQYKIEEIGIQETKVYLDDTVDYYNSLNEIVVREENLNTLKLDISIDNTKLENFAGDGILISTSFGSTAYNLSFGGSIIYNELHTLQITPIAPLNSKSYRSLVNSLVISKSRIITLKTNNSIILTIDGENHIYDNIKKVETSVNGEIKLLHLKEYDYTKKINEKFIK